MSEKDVSEETKHVNQGGTYTKSVGEGVPARFETARSNVGTPLLNGLSISRKTI